MLETLERLCKLDGVSGNEASVREFIINEIKDFCDYKIDNLGNIIAFKKGEKQSFRKIMIDAHIDEVGLLITNITSEGYLKFDIIGGIDISALISRKVRINSQIFGVINSKPIHLLKGEQKKKLPAISELYIDIGAYDKAEASALVNLGDTAVVCGDFIRNGDLILSKAIDDRIGVAILIDLIKEKSEYDFYASFTYGEEIELRGAKTAAYQINPEACIVLEATTAADIPQNDEASKVCKIGGGAVVSFMDKATCYDREYYNCALNSGKLCQPKSAVAGGNNAGAIHLSGEGVRTIAISLPTRYIHTSSSVASLEDAKKVKELAIYMLNKIGGGEI